MLSPLFVLKCLFELLHVYPFDKCEHECHLMKQNDTGSAADRRTVDRKHSSVTAAHAGDTKTFTLYSVCQHLSTVLGVTFELLSITAGQEILTETVSLFLFSLEKFKISS